MVKSVLGNLGIIGPRKLRAMFGLTNYISKLLTEKPQHKITLYKMQPY